MKTTVKEFNRLLDALVSAAHEQAQFAAWCEETDEKLAVFEAKVEQARDAVLSAALEGVEG
jgi:hypothetical protein